jgi:hypothetical protein
MNPLLRAFMMLSSLVWISVQTAWAEPLTEERVKSAYVLNFIKLVDWPAGAIPIDGQMALCVLGLNPLGGALSALDGRHAGERTIRVQRVKAEDDLKSCHVLFIGESEQHRVAAIIGTLSDAPVLTISDMDNFAERGGNIGLVLEGSRIIFEVNLTSARSGRLLLPGQMLNLATHVFGR